MSKSKSKSKSKFSSLAWSMAVVLLGLMLTACQTVKTTQAGAIGVEREQRMSTMVKEEDLRASSAVQYKEVLGKEQAKGALNSDPALTARVRAIAKRLIPVTATFRADAPGWPWEINVIRSDQLNAWCMPGGKIAFYSGLIEKLAMNDDEIAAVMGHEIAHALREHARERISEQATSQIGISVASVALGGGKVGADLGQLAYQMAFSLPHSRLHETEADRIGVELSARAGYDPHAAVRVWQKMAKLGGSKGPEFLSTHPSSESRIADLEAYAQRVAPLYDQAKRKH